MRKKVTKQMAMLLSAVFIASAVTGCGNGSANGDAKNADSKAAPTTEVKDAGNVEVTTKESENVATKATTEAPEVTTEATTAATTTAKEQPSSQERTVYDEAELSGINVPEGYQMVWHDEFDGEELNEADWNREAHEVGWVNHELQEYVPTSEYSFVKDGELVIQPVKIVDDAGNVSYVSGRVNTQNKHDIKYGWIEAKIKFPQGKGFLPAFWMMPKEESFYGNWPRCGEIDIAEVLGDSINTTYGTIHYGVPHKQNQGTFSLNEGDFANEYHVYALEWEPGSIKWYVDGEMFYETNDWYTSGDDGEKPYPAPFNQPFHVILNVAVGGDWPGSPDDTTVFDDRAAMKVDYVRMFQKDSYDENVTKPEKVLEMREADETGNFVHNSDFSVAEELSDDTDWVFYELNSGKGSAEIKDGEIVITTENSGSEEYSIQLVQAEMPMEKGAKYKLSFDAYADEARQMKTAVTAPNVNWIRYFPDTTVDLTTESQKFEFEFDMTEESDDKGRVEFNMGKQESTATIHITNVRLEKVN